MTALAVLAVLAVLIGVTTGCGESRTERPGTTPSATPSTDATSPKQPRPEDSAMPGPLPKPGAPSTATDNPTGTGTGR